MKVKVLITAINSHETGTIISVMADAIMVRLDCNLYVGGNLYSTVRITNRNIILTEELKSWLRGERKKLKAQQSQST
jgi:hypothetical protein